LKTLIFTATYNERENIPILLQDIWQHVSTADVLVVDDGSPDGTGELLRELVKTESRLHVIHRPGKLGLGSAHSLAMLYAIKHQYDCLVTMDADLSHAPSDIPRLIDGIEKGADFVIGSRYMPGGACDYEGYRKQLSVVGNRFARLLLQIPIHEFTTSFRAFRIDKLRQLDFRWINNYGYSFFLEVVFSLERAGLVIQEEPIHFYNRNYGSSKIPHLEIVRGMKKLITLWLTKIFDSQGDKCSPNFHTTHQQHCLACQSPFLYRQSDQLNRPTRVDTLLCCLQCNHVQLLSVK